MSWNRLGVACLLATVTVACSSAAGDAREQSSDVVTAPVDLSAVPRGNFVHAKNVEHYALFAGHDAAVAWWGSYEAEAAAREGRPPRPVVSAGDARYAIAEHVMMELWPAFQRLFPDDTRDLPRPVVLIVEDPSVNAFATFDRTLGLAPNAFIIQTGALSSAEVTDALRGLVGHELAHLVLKHPFPGNADRIAKYYRAQGGEPLGFQATNDAELQAAVQSWLGDALVAGSFPLPELHGLPINIIGTPPILLSALKTALIAGVSTHPTECGPAAEKANALIAAMTRHTSLVNYDMDLSPAARAEIDAAAQAAASILEPCLATSTKTVPELLAGTFGIPVDAVESSFAPSDLALLRASPAAFDAIRSLTTHVFDRMRTVGARIELDTVRYYSTEEQADDASVYVLAALGKNPEGQGLFLANETMTPEQRTACFAHLRAGDAPYGLLSDAHHGACWRIGHMHRIHEAVAPAASGTYESD